MVKVDQESFGSYFPSSILSTFLTIFLASECARCAEWMWRQPLLSLELNGLDRNWEKKCQLEREIAAWTHNALAFVL